MAKIVGGFGSSHGSSMYRTAEEWEEHGRDDMRNGELVMPPHGKRVTYEELLAAADPAIVKVVNVETYQTRVDHLQKGLDELNERFGAANPDVVVMIGDDQSEWFFDDNYPSIHVYWGETIQMYPRRVRPGDKGQEPREAAASGAKAVDYPVDTTLGLHLIESLMDQEFDVAHSQYQKEAYGGSIGPATWYLDRKRTTAPRPFGMPHAYSFPIVRWFAGKTPPMVPVTINTCYPPNWISPKRAFALGRALRKAVAEWRSDKRVAFVCSGGLSHFVVDEELDRQALKGMAEANGEILSSLPRIRLQSATTETLNWVTTAGAMGDAKMEVLTYEAGYRSLAGTGGGWAVGHWH